MSSEHRAITSFRDELTRRAGTGDVVILPDTAHTAVLAAQALGCEVGAIANSLLFDADGSPVLILTSGAHRVDTAEHQRCRHTVAGQVIGSMTLITVRRTTQ